MSRYSTFFFHHPDGWYFVGYDGKLVGPYTTRERAEDKADEYDAYVVNAPRCHHDIN